MTSTPQAAAEAFAASLAASAETAYDLAQSLARHPGSGGSTAAPLPADIVALPAAVVALRDELRPLQSAVSNISGLHAEVAALQAAAGASLPEDVAALRRDLAPLVAVPATVALLRTEVLALRRLVARVHNFTCGTGVPRTYEPVPNAAGADAPANMQPLRTWEELNNLAGSGLTAWCQFFAAQLPVAISDRKRLVVRHLNLDPSVTLA